MGKAHLGLRTPVLGRRSGVPMRTRARHSKTPTDRPAVMEPQEQAGREDFSPNRQQVADQGRSPSPLPPAAVSAAPRRRAKATRASRMWVRTLPALLVVALILVFVFQNLQHARVHFLSFSGSLPIALALLGAAALGALAMLALGSVRILQLRKTLRGERSSSQGAGRRFRAPSQSGRSESQVVETSTPEEQR